VKFVADESVDKPIVDALRTDDHEVYYILEENRGIPDDEVLKIANNKNSILLTADKDFGDIVYRQKRNHHGIILFRLAGLNIEKKIQTIISALNQHHNEIENHFSVISKTHIRIIKS
jgi:predicted nuclease of predicted toxin-antitoxin system